jgi:hypothetical protein
MRSEMSPVRLFVACTARTGSPVNLGPRHLRRRNSISPTRKNGWASLWNRAADQKITVLGHCRQMREEFLVHFGDRD